MVTQSYSYTGHPTSKDHFADVPNFLISQMGSIHMILNANSSFIALVVNFTWAWPKQDQDKERDEIK